MATVNDFLKYLYEMAPQKYAMPDDNTGLLCGSGQIKVTRVMVSLDITCPVIDEAHDLGVQLIISHHPIFFSLNRVNDESPQGKAALHLLNRNMSAICMHTNLDAAPGGLNDLLARKIGLLEPFVSPDKYGVPQISENGYPHGLIRTGLIDTPTPLPEFARAVKAALGTVGLRYLDCGVPAARVAVSSGSGGSTFECAVAAGCDTFITGDVKYHMYVDARTRGINLIDATHFATENIVVDLLLNRLQCNFPQVEFFAARSHKDFTTFI